LEGFGKLIYIDGENNQTEEQISFDYFYNSKRVSDFNTSQFYTGQRGEIEIIIDNYFNEINPHYNNIKVLFDDGRLFRIVNNEPISGFGLEATIFIGVLENANE